MKKCICCKKEKNKSEFGKNKKFKDGLHIYCKECVNKKCKKWRQNNPEKAKKSIRIWQKKNRDRVNKVSYEWVKNNPEKVKIATKKWNKNNKEKKREIFRNWSERNKEKRQIYNKNWQKKNKDKIKIYSKTRVNIIRNNPILKLRYTTSSAIKKKLKRRLISKNGVSTFTFLPYTVDELKIHIENQFEPWMNWDNWGMGKGKWNIDHIKPDSSFNYKSTEDKEFKDCWALSNLRPLDAIENIKKGNKIICT